MTWLIEYFDIHEGCNKTRRVYVPYAETAVSIVNYRMTFLYGIPAPIMGIREGGNHIEVVQLENLTKQTRPFVR